MADAAARIVFDIAGSSGDLDVDTERDGPARALVENRRVVATAVVADGGEPQTRRELSRMVAELAYKHGALVHGHSPDGLVAVFGLEVAGEDDIASAMQFSLDAVELARETTGPSLRVATRAGIAAQRSPRTLRLRGGEGSGGRHGSEVDDGGADDGTTKHGSGLLEAHGSRH